MITLVEGAIGSGKTYFVVNELVSRFFSWDADNLCFRRIDDSFEIYTNIDGFFLGKDLKLFIEKYGGIESFFTVDVQREITNQKKHVYVIDEAQMMFPRKFYNVRVFNFFQYSRHLGVDIYIITQDVYSLARELQTLSEFHIRVVRRSHSFFGEFRYHYIVGNEVLKRRTLKPDIRVFSQYRSSMVNDSHKVFKFSSRYFVYIFLLLLAVFGGGFGFLYVFTGGSYFRKNSLPPAKFVPDSGRVLTRSVRLVGVSNGVGYFVDFDGKLVKKVKIK